MSQREAEKDDGNAAKLGASLRATMAELVRAREPDPAHAPAKRRVRQWQNERFARTYADLARQARYKAAARFFFVELYGDVDMSARDTDLEHVLPLMIKLLPAPALETIRDALAFEALSERLDGEMARYLHGRKITERSYAEAFRACGQQPMRQQQIRYVTQVGRALDRLTKWPMIRTTLRLMRGPAVAAGLGALHEFLDRGFGAFKQMGGAEQFLATIDERETLIFERLFAGHPRPFDLEDTA